MGVTDTKIIKSGIYFEIAITTDRSGRTSIVVTDNRRNCPQPIVDVELPCKTGEYKDAFKPSVKVQKAEVEIEEV
jgi:hypothetical protein